MAEVVVAYFPSLVDLNNYTASNSTKQKLYNYNTLNSKVFKKMGFSIPRTLLEDAVNCRPLAVENILNILQYKMLHYREKRAVTIAADLNTTGESTSIRQMISSTTSSPIVKATTIIGKATVFDATSRTVEPSASPSNNSAAPTSTPRMSPNKMRGSPNTFSSPMSKAIIGGAGEAKPTMVAIDEEILFEKEKKIRKLEETIEILQLKVAKLEQLLRLKDVQISNGKI